MVVKVLAGGAEAGVLTYNRFDREYVFVYTADNPISVVMPTERQAYSQKWDMIPVFDQRMPEGWLYEVLLNFLRKEFGSIDEFDMFCALVPNIEGFLTFELSGKSGSKQLKTDVSLSEVLSADGREIFRYLVEMFLSKSAVSGVQPKVLADLSVEHKALVQTRSFVVKTFGDAFPFLTVVEFLCLEACRHAGLPVPAVHLSDDWRLLIVERFDTELAFEEFCTLFWKTRRGKYDGSYEKIARALGKISCQPEADLSSFYRMFVMNQLLKNGDAHLKNFGIVYSTPLAGDIKLAPVYDVVCTVVYIPNDLPALTVSGRKLWLSRKKMIEFGIAACGLTHSDALETFEQCENAVAWLQKQLPHWIEEAPSPNAAKVLRHFSKVLEFSLTENLKKTYRRLGHVLGQLEFRGENTKTAQKGKGPYPNRTRP